MASREYYSEVIDEMKKAQGKLCQALYTDLQRLEGAESNGTKVKVQEAYERGVNEAFDVIFTLFEMQPLDRQECLKSYGLDNMEQFFKSENRVERVKQVQHTVRVVRAEELKVGDEVYYEGTKCVVVEKKEGGHVVLFYPQTIVAVDSYAKKCEKTGRHFVVTEMMKAIEEMKK